MKGFFTPEGVWREETVFSPEETDQWGRVRPEAVLYRFQEIAGDHYTSLGMGRDAAVARGCFWAVTRNELQLERLPAAGERLWLDTWAGRRGHGLFWRHYRLSDPAGPVLIRGVSTWVVMDLESRTLSRDYVWAQAAPPVKQEGELPSTFRSPVFPEELPDRARRTVTEAETDINGHLNNALYFPWGADLLPAGYTETHELRSVWIEYRKELPKGHEAELHSSFGDGILYVKGFDADKECFSMRVEYV